MKYFFLFILLGLTLPIKAFDNLVSSEKLFQSYYDSVIYEGKGNKCLAFTFNMLKISTELNNDSLIAIANFEISHSYKTLGNYPSALNYIFKSAKYYHDNGIDTGLSTTYNVIGSIYSAQGNYELSISYLKKALNIHLKNKKLMHACDDYINIGEAYRLSRNYDTAYYYFNEAYKITQEIKTDSLRIAYSQCNIGLIYMHQNFESKADSLFALSFNYLRSINDYYPECITNYEIALKAFNDKNIVKATQYTIFAKNMANKYGFRKELIDILLLSSEISQEKGDYQKAFEYLAQYQVYKDSLINDKKVSQMAEMRAEFEISQNETEMSYLKNINKQRTNLLFVALFGLMAIAVLSIFVLLVNKKRKVANHLLSEFNEELQQKNEIIYVALEEKDVLMKEIHHRVKNNLQIISSIINLQSMRIDDPEMQEIFSEMQRRILAIASIHQKLYQGSSISLINMKEYLGEVVESIHMALNTNELNVGYEIAIQNVDIDLDTAVALGLIVNELTTNAYKYAFKAERNNSLALSLIKNQHNGIDLTLQDNGMGMPEGFNIANSNSLGLRMVSLLIRQNNGTVAYNNDNGTRIEISLGINSVL